MSISLSCGRKFHSDHLAAALWRAGALDQVFTANPSWAYRRHRSIQHKVVHTFPYYLPGLLLGRLPGVQRLASSLDWWATRRFDAAVAKQLGSPSTLIAWAWSAHRSFEVAKAHGIQCVLEECGSANLQQFNILTEEYSRFGLAYHSPIAQRVIENERRECELADIILCPSAYVADSFSSYGVPRSTCLVIPYATNPRFRAAQPKLPRERLEILYVGSVGFRKGLIYLLRALAELDDARVSCTVIGQVDPVMAPFLKPFQHLFRHIPSVPHTEMPEHFARANLFVLPTLDEGMAYVVMEALASGTPVITTPHSGAEGMVSHCSNGFLVPIRDSHAIASVLGECLEDPHLIPRLSAAALASSAGWSWDDYVEQLVASLERGLPTVS
ncbi:glycosyltransferase family 4 protein [Cyanobium sp. Morenito 9A2]|uniref:glycosyltransferase family 4 protein n=1 Tax=Cyanobium sp. Morenito 9A2 TaxID=2823718 RepID=UPI0020CB83CB|nr:glycosyltransferase family 4 protein [Cyanobium sp. Morenito 9A2]MCP9849783.1 glycosyltransferase family 4 protein [Cyanobium sp. Morenito 9A2]